MSDQNRAEVRYGDFVVLRDCESKQMLMPGFTDRAGSMLGSLQEAGKPFPQTPDIHRWWIRLGPQIDVLTGDLARRPGRRFDVRIRPGDPMLLQSSYANGYCLGMPTTHHMTAGYPEVGAGYANANTLVAADWIIRGVTKLKPRTGGGFEPADDSVEADVFYYEETYISLFNATRGKYLSLVLDNPRRIDALRGDAATVPTWWTFEKA